MVYIGTYNSGAAKLSIPILNAACLIMLSPANSYPGLTHAVNGVTAQGEPDSYYPGGYRNYARVINTDDNQGGASSEWALSLGFKKAYVVDDGQTYGQGIGRAWALHFGKIGGTVVSANGSSESYDPKATDFQALGQKIKSSGADVVFVGAITGQGTAKLWKDIKQVNPNIQMFGPDGVNEKPWYDGTGAAGNGTYLTFGGVDISQLQGTGKTWADEYKTAHNGTSRPFYATYAKASAQVTLAALQKAATNDRLAGPQGHHGHERARHGRRPDGLRCQRRRQGRRDLELPGRHQLAARVQGRHHPVEVTARRPPDIATSGRASQPAPDAIWPIRAPSHHEGTSTAWTN